MNKASQQAYKKWLEIRKHFKDSQLVMNMCGGCRISSGNNVLLEIPHEEFETLTANEIVEILRSNEDG